MSSIQSPFESVRRTARLRGRRGGIVASLVLAGATLAACDGHNAFAGDERLLLPNIVQLLAPPSATTGGTLDVTVQAVAPRAVDRIQISVRGSFVKDTIVIVNPPAASITETIRIPIPAGVRDSVTVTATVFDRAGVSSPARSTSVTIDSPPVLQLTVPHTARRGQNVTVGVSASSSRDITHVNLTFAGAMNRDTVVSVGPDRDITRNVTVLMPNAVADTLLTVTATAVDITNRSSPTITREIPVAIELPTILLTAPISAAPAGMVDLQVRAQGTRPITQIRLQLRGAVARDTVVPILPARLDVLQLISVQLPGDITESPLNIHAYAFDSANQMSAPSSASVTIVLGAPIVVNVTPLFDETVHAGKTADVRVHAQGVRRLTEIDVRWRGVAEQTIIHPITPPRFEEMRFFEMVVPEDTEGGEITVYVTVRDEAGVLSPTISTTFTVIPKKDDDEDDENGASGSAALQRSGQTKSIGTPRVFWNLERR